MRATANMSWLKLLKWAKYLYWIAHYKIANSLPSKDRDFSETMIDIMHKYERLKSPNWKWESYYLFNDYGCENESIKKGRHEIWLSPSPYYCRPGHNLLVDLYIDQKTNEVCGIGFTEISLQSVIKESSFYVRGYFENGSGI